ncbi:MAG: clostripain-related cysteine peptidase [Pyrinomonadaceae bacterium]
MSRPKEPSRVEKAVKRPTKKPGLTPKKWTIMVYMAGDNNLSEDMITGLKGMKELMGHSNINLIALYDSNYPPVPVKIYEFSKASPGHSRAKDLDLSYFESPLSPLPRPANPQLESYWIKSFVPLVTDHFPAEKYALILSGHSDGIIGKTLLRDENPNVVLDVPKLEKILYDARPFDAVSGRRKKFDLLGFDGCLMSMVEIGYELRNVANVMVASEGNIPTTGWPYEKVLADLMGEPTMDECKFAEKIVEQYARHNVDYSISGRSIDISACNLNRARPLAAAIHVFGKRLYDLLSLVPFKEEKNNDDATVKSRLIREHFIDCVLLAHYHSQTFMHNQAVDLVDFVFNLILQSLKRLTEQNYLNTQTLKDENTQTLTHEVSLRIFKETEDLFGDFEQILAVLFSNDEGKDGEDASAGCLNRPYIISNCSTGAEYQFSRGASIFFPWSDMALEMIYGRYAEFKFNQNANWLNLIEKRLDLTRRTQYHIPFTPFGAKAGGGINLFDLNISLYHALAHREHGGKEHGGKEHGGKGELDAFYRYFSQFRNYDAEFFDKTC